MIVRHLAEAPDRAVLNNMMTNVVQVMRSASGEAKRRVLLDTVSESLMKAVPALLPGLYFTSSSEAKKNLVGALDGTIANIINRLDGPSRNEVMAGTLDPRKWLAASEEVRRGISGLLKIYGDETTARQVDDVVELAKREVSNYLKQAGDFWEKYKYLILGGAGVLGVSVLYVMFRVSPLGMALREYEK